MNFIIANTFTQSLSRLDGVAQAAVKQAVFDFQINPKKPSFQFHRIDRAKDKDFWTARVNDDMRMVIHHRGDDMVFCYVDHHDDAYAWGERRKLEINPATGAAQIVELKERVEEIIKKVVREVEQEPPLFAKYEPSYLQALGVPEEYLPALRTLGQSGFIKLLDVLPQEAAERLMQLAQGEVVPVPMAPTPSQSPFAHPDARRRFWVVDSQQELARALDAPWEQWLVFLHPTQRGVVERRFKGPARVTGAAGTGKTVVALHRAARLVVADPESRVLLTTFSKTLAARLAQHADVLMGVDSKPRKRLDIDHLHKAARDLWVARTGKTFTALDPKGLNALLELAMSRAAPGLGLPAGFLRSEWDSVIDPWGVRSWAAYKAISRAGRSTPLGAKQRLAVWKVFEEAYRLLAERRLLTWSGLCYEVASTLYDARPYTHVVADESQDFGPAELTLLRALVEPGEDDLFLCGDAGQRIYKTPFSWASVGIDVRGRSTRLGINYRTTEQIRAFADGLLPDALDEGDGDKEKRSTVSLLRGPRPEVVGFEGMAQEVDGIAQRLRALLAEGYKARDIAIFGRTEVVLRERAALALEKAGLRGHYLSDEQPPSTSNASLGTMHRAKGLEFKVVVVMGCDADVLPLAHALNDLADEADRETFFEQERQLLYVACTRARERLLVSYTGKASRWVVERTGTS